MEDAEKRTEFLRATREAFALGEPVGIPTETVYGLAAPIDQPRILRRVFELKSRPFFDPLIVHVASVEQAKALVADWPPAAEILARAFWPGPLTLVLKKTDLVDSLISAGLPTVGVRQPKHPLTLALIEDLGVPLAAPSANKFTKTSPTCAAHVRKAFPGLTVLDGGSGDVGIESTIIQLEREEEIFVWKVLRPGMISRASIRQVLEANNIAHREIEAKAEIAPGNFEVHYQPTKPLMVLVHSRAEEHEGEAAVKEWLERRMGAKAHVQGRRLQLSDDAFIAARELYAELHSADEDLRAEFLYAVLPAKASSGAEWMGVMDRLQKAASLGVHKI